MLFSSVWSFSVEVKLWRFFIIILYLLLLEIQLLRCKCWNPIKRFNPTTYLCLSQGRTYIFNAISWSFFDVAWLEMRCGLFLVDINRIFTFTVETMLLSYINTVKPAHAVTSIKQSPVLKGHLFLVLSEIFKLIYPLLRSHLS